MREGGVHKWMECRGLGVGFGTYLAPTPAATFYDTCRRLPKVLVTPADTCQTCVCVCVAMCLYQTA